MGGCVSSQTSVKIGPDHQKYNVDKHQDDGSLREKAKLASQQENGHSAAGQAHTDNGWPLPVSEVYSHCPPLHAAKAVPMHVGTPNQ